MLIWIEHEPVQKNAAGPDVKAPTAQAPSEATLDGGRTDYPPAAALGNLTFSDPPIPDAKALATIAAKLALVGRELHVITKEGRSYFEIRCWSECHTCSTLNDLRGLLGQFGTAA